jgi:hypothetical protein
MAKFGRAMAERLPQLLDDDEVARLLRYRSTAAFRRCRGANRAPQQSEADAMEELADKWGTST